MLYRILGNHFVLKMVVIELGMKTIISFKEALW